MFRNVFNEIVFMSPTEHILILGIKEITGSQVWKVRRLGKNNIWFLIVLNKQVHYYGEWAVGCSATTLVFFCKMFLVTIAKRLYSTLDWLFNLEPKIQSTQLEIEKLTLSLIRAVFFFVARLPLANPLLWLNFCLNIVVFVIACLFKQLQANLYGVSVFLEYCKMKFMGAMFFFSLIIRYRWFV